MSKNLPFTAGEQYNRLTTIKEDYRPIIVSGKRTRRRIWECRCACGVVKTFTRTQVVSGAAKSCGCLVRDRMRELNRSHGLCVFPEYHLWRNVMNRCYNPRSHAYARYGGRGIAVCERWHDPSNFLKDMGPRDRTGLTLERIDNDGNYEPGNCRWATQAEQTLNTCRTRRLSFNGREQALSQWAAELGMSPAALARRLGKWTLEDALTLPKGARGHVRKATDD